MVVLHYNGLPDTLACLHSLQIGRGRPVDLIVVDNASQDGGAEAIRAADPAIHLVMNRTNLGYAGGNNIGIRAALERGADAVFLLNNDTLLDPDCVSRLACVLASDPRIGVTGPMVYTFNETPLISSAGGVIDWHHADAGNTGAGEIDRGQYPARSVDFVNGCGLMVSRAAIARTGLLDERYFMYWEETDWCTRIKRAGFEIHFEPAAQMRHKAAIRSDDLGPTTLYYMTRNRLLFFSRHAPLRLIPITIAHAIHGALREAARYQRAGRPEHARAMRRGIVHGVQRRWGRAQAGIGQPERPATPSPANLNATRPEQ
ncbi:MAG TPA: glycosyltransferase family 2 protein [Anaerolineae bacterium]